MNPGKRDKGGVLLAEAGGGGGAKKKKKKGGGGGKKKKKGIPVLFCTKVINHLDGFCFSIACHLLCRHIPV